MRNMVKYLGIAAFVAAAALFSGCKFELSTRPEVVPPEFIPVEEIIGIPTGSRPRLEITLSGTVMPSNATNKKIEWSVKTDGGTRAALERNRLTANGYGTVTVTARVKNGSGGNVDYTQDFDILISATMIAVTSIEGIPASVPVGEYTLNGRVKPSNALNKTITWSVKEAGETGTEIYGNILTTTAAGTAVITATVADGKLDSDYTQDFTIMVVWPFVEVTGITGIPSTVLIGDYELNGAVTPSNATNQTIAWRVRNAGTSGAIIVDGNILRTTAEGTAVITATVAKGLLIGSYTQDFSINVTETYIEVTGITGILTTVQAGDYALNGVVDPPDAANTAIVWSVKDAGTTNAAISGNTLTTTAAGTVTVTATIAGGLLTGNYTQDFEITVFVIEVTGITGISATVPAGDYELNGVVAPSDATNTTIVWSVKDAGTTDATIDGNTLTTTAAGTVVITATIAGGLSNGDYTQDFTIIIPIISVTSITGIPSTVEIGEYTLNGAIAPSNATNQNIVWSVKDAGTTGATIDGNTLTTTAAGTVTVTAAIANGVSDTTNYTHDFEITVTTTFVEVTGISGIPATVQVGEHVLNGTVAPPDASNQNIEWSVKDAGTTYATISGDTLTVTAPGTAEITATITNGLLDGNYTQDFEITITPKPVYAAGYYYEGNYMFFPDGITATTACYWIDGELVELDVPNGTTFSYTTGIVIVNDIPYIAGYYTSGSDNVACYWVDGTRHDLPDGSGPAVSNGTKTFSITADGSTVYIAGKVSYEYCYWKIEGNSAVKTVLSSLSEEEGGYSNIIYYGSIAVNNGALYIPFSNNGMFYDESLKNYYWDENGTVHEINSSYEIFSVTVLNGTVYMMGRLWNQIDGEEGPEYTMRPFYWTVGGSSHTVSNSDGDIWSIVVQNVSLWFYGSDENYQACYWNAAGNKTVLGNEYRSSTVVFSNGNVYIAYDDGSGNGGYRIPGIGGQFTQLRGNAETPENVKVTGLAVP